MEIAYQLVATLASTFIATLSGFGFALALIPALVVVMDAKSAVILTLLLFMFVGTMITWASRKDVNRRLLATLLISSFAGMPLGAFVLVIISESLLRLLIGILIVAASILLLSNYKRPFANERLAAVIVGFLGGLMNTSVVVCGPFVALFLANQKMGKEELRATMSAFLLGITPISLLFFYLGGLITVPLLVTALPLIPAVLIGYFLGVRFLPRVDAALFNRILVLLVLFAGAGIFVGEVRSILGI